MSRSAADRIAVAVIGAGFIADYHINGLRAAGGADIAVLVGRRPDATLARAQALGIGRAESDYRRVLDDGAIDAVVIATPDDTHERIAIDALDAGKHVLLQKPMALDSAQCRNILQADERAGRRLTVSFMHRYFPEVRWLRELLQSGALGAIHSARIRNATPGADWNDWFFTPGNVSGGVVMQLGVHGIDLVQHLLGPIENVAADMMTARPERRLADGRTVRTALEDNVHAAYRLESGVRVSHEMSYTELAGCDRFRLELYAERGTVWLRTERGAAAIHAPALTGEAGWTNPALPEEALGEAHHRHWLSIIRGETAPDDTPAAGLRTVRVAETIYAAARSGVRTPVDGEGEKAGCA
ncbi:Gfo/Idh/MocA family protein [Shinella sp.]|uniref:Gfo/Idh/MocA family protein n=1 Tax=Shinella sp. TaxID=1870904 RepID=UPI003F700661